MAWPRRAVQADNRAFSPVHPPRWLIIHRQTVRIGKDCFKSGVINPILKMLVRQLWR